MPPRLLAFSVAATVFFLDRIAKLIVRAHVDSWRTLRVIPGCFNIVHAENPGMAFSLLADAPEIWRRLFLIGLSGCVLIYIAFLLWGPGKSAVSGLLLRIGLACILGGALGNLYDRILKGAVTDFIELYAGEHYFPAFNVADSAISVGAGLLLLDMWRARAGKLRPSAEHG